MASQVALGQEVMDLINDAFGLTGETTRIVIDLEVNCAARIIRVDYLTESQSHQLVDSLKRCNADVIGG